MIASHFDWERHASRAEPLLKFLEELNEPFGLEHSFRVCPRGIFAHRFLASTARTSVDCQAVVELCLRLGIPNHCSGEVHHHLESAKFLHLGYEEGSASCLYKIYLETGHDCEPEGSVVQHHAIKWDSIDNSKYVRSKYIWYRLQTVTNVLDRLDAIYGGDSESSLEIARDMIFLGASRIPVEDLHYMEVTESGSLRSSFDINFYSAELRVQDLVPFLVRACERYSTSISELQSLCDSIGGEVLGHLAGGIHRNGDEFFNVYYGVEQRQGQSPAHGPIRG
ncbi:MAG: hypothetical protein H6822_18200 [Planctomycetaceae bacterium]|nr:hypothetical protein [Planctomycetales bacterium]MCB9924118.1 hypothetical protein [Planctomycetaceae bacterium]